MLASGSPVDLFIFNQTVGYFFPSHATSVCCVLAASPGVREVKVRDSARTQQISIGVTNSGR